MIEVILKPDESIEVALRRFRKKVIKSGLLTEIFERRHFVGKAEQRNLRNRSHRRE